MWGLQRYRQPRARRALKIRVRPKSGSLSRERPIRPSVWGNGDLVEVGVYNVPELASKSRVDGNGDLYLPLIDYVHVAGLTLDEAQKVVEKKLDEGRVCEKPPCNHLRR